MFDKKREDVQAGSTEHQQHEVAKQFEDNTKEKLYREWGIFEARYGAVLNLKEDASKADVKRAVARVKRAAMDVRDVLKELGQFKA
jgi:hypothetical protein